MPEPSIRVRDFRILERLDWSPGDVCVLSGPNGAGKSTTLDAFKFVRALFMWGAESAFRAVDGVAFKRWGSPASDPVEFEVEVGDLHWRLRLPMSAQGAKGLYGEELYRSGEPVLRAAMFQEEWYLGKDAQPRDETRCCAKVLWDRGTEPWLKPLADVLEGMRIYDTYWLNQVKRVEPAAGTDTYLHYTGRNLWSVLSTWKASPLRYRGQFEWVMSEARRAFPGILGGIEFDRGLPYL